MKGILIALATALVAVLAKMAFLAIGLPTVGLCVQWAVITGVIITLANRNN